MGYLGATSYRQVVFRILDFFKGLQMKSIATLRVIEERNTRFIRKNYRLKI
jgi:hypothetical protein